MAPIKLRYTEALVRRAVKLFWWRTTGWTFVVASLLVLGSFVFLVWGGDRSWVVGLLGTVLALAVAFAVTLYLVHYRASLRRFHRMRTPEATLELGEESFRVSSDIGMSELAWSAVSEVWSFPEVVLVFFSKSQFMTIPRADLDASALEFIVAKARSHGAKVA